MCLHLQDFKDVRQKGANKKSKGKKNEKKNLAATTQYSPTLFAFI
jgi:hypothetical protein